MHNMPPPVNKMQSQHEQNMQLPMLSMQLENNMQAFEACAIEGLKDMLDITVIDT